MEEFCIGIPRVETDSFCARVITKGKVYRKCFKNTRRLSFGASGVSFYKILTMYIKICVLPFGRDWHTRINTWNIIKSNAEYIFYTRTRYIFAPLNQQKNPSIRQHIL